MLASPSSDDATVTPTPTPVSSPPQTPASLILLSPDSSPNNSTQPVVRVTGVTAGDIVTVYGDASCTSAVSGAVTSAGSTVDITLNSGLSYGTHDFYARSTNASGLQSDCSTTPLNDVIGSVMQWRSGSNTVSALPVHGTKGVAASGNTPGARSSFAYAKDSAGNFWLFGGSGPDSTGSVGYLNDLWKFDGVNWTWVAGSKLAAQSSVYGTKGVADPANVPGGRGSAALWVDSHGNVWLYGGVEAANRGDMWKFDGANWTWVAGPNTTNQVGVYGTLGVADPSNYPGTRYGIGATIDTSDNLYIFGGQVWSGGNNNFSDMWKFDGADFTWIGGPNASNQNGVYGTKGTAAASNNPGGRKFMVSCWDASRRLWIFGGTGYGASGGAGKLNDLWRYDGTNWTWLAGSQTVDQSGVYGTLGVGNSANAPGGRSATACAVDSHNVFWLFGGGGYDSAGGFGSMNDIWKFDGTNWIWVRGSNTISGAPVYGSLGVYGLDVVFGARGGQGAWVDSSDRIWIYGGSGLDSGGANNVLNDMFLFAP